MLVELIMRPLNAILTSCLFRLARSMKHYHTSGEARVLKKTPYGLRERSSKLSKICIMLSVTSGYEIQLGRYGSTRYASIRMTRTRNLGKFR